MSPELETLDQLLGGDLPASVIRKLFPDNERFMTAMRAMLTAGELRLMATDGTEIPRWKWSDALASRVDFVRLAITDVGARRIE